MEFYDVVRARKSCRDYTDQIVSKQQLMRVLEAARLAPSWKNGQCWRYFVLSDRDVITRLAAVMRNNPCENAYTKATYIIIQCAVPDESGNLYDKQYYMLDCGISMEHLCLAAASEGLGTCWVGWFDEPAVKSVLNIPEELRVVSLTPLGYPTGNYRQKPRKDMSEIIFY